MVSRGLEDKLEENSWKSENNKKRWKSEEKINDSTRPCKSYKNSRKREVDIRKFPVTGTCFSEWKEHKIPNIINENNTQRFSTRYTIVKFQNTIDKEKILKIPEINIYIYIYTHTHIYIIGNISEIMMPLDFSTPTTSEAERHLSIVFKLLRQNYFKTLKFYTQPNY